MSPRFQLQLDRGVFRAGEKLKGTVLVTQGGGSRTLEAALEYREEVEDFVEVATSISSGPLHSGDLAAGVSFEFELPVPEDALPSYRSEHGELYWELDVKSDESGVDTHERRRIEIRPSDRGPDDAPGVFEPTPDAELAPMPAGQAPRRIPMPSKRLGSWRWRSEGSGLTRWIVPLFLAIGVVALLVGVVTLVLTMRFVQRAEKATGTVVQLSRETDSEGEVSFYPVVRFETAEGREIEFKSSSGSSPPSHSEGDEVEVLYDPDDPQDARLSGFFDLWLFPIVGFALGFGFIVVTLFVRRQLSSEP